MVFIGRRPPFDGVVVFAPLVPMVASTTVAFYRVGKISDLLLVPYLCYVDFVSALNLAPSALPPQHSRIGSGPWTTAGRTETPV